MASSGGFFTGIDDLFKTVIQQEKQEKNKPTQAPETEPKPGPSQAPDPVPDPVPKTPTNFCPPPPNPLPPPPPPPPKPSREERLKTSKIRLNKALSDIVEATNERVDALKENQALNTEYDKKDNYFQVLKCSITPSVPTAIIGAHVKQVAKSSEIELAVNELDIKNKCSLVYNENESLKFFRDHENLILQIAVQLFSRHDNTKCVGAEICVKGNEKNKFVNKLVVKKLPNAPSSSSTVLEIRGATRNLLENNFNKGENNTVNENKDIPPSERANLDTTKAEISHVFSTLHRLDTKRKLFFKGNTFYQRKPTFDNKFRWTEVIGWTESEASKQTTKSLDKPTDDNLFVLPHSFNNLADHLRLKFKNVLYKNSTAHPGKRNYYKTQETLINPQIDSAKEYKMVFTEIDKCLDVLLAIGKNDKYTKSTVIQYRGKFRRYLIFCYAFYALNKAKHSRAVSPLPFNFFNLFSFMYCHGPFLHSASFLSTLTFVYQHMFFPMGTAAPSVSAKRLMDIDSALMKGGKGVGVRDFGSPSKTSLHTRTLVSFLGFAEMAMGTMTALLSGVEVRVSPALQQRISKSLERWCDSVIFIYFTFVLFHRFSGAKKVSLESALRLIMGQTHAHTNKVRAAKRCRIEAAEMEGVEEEEAGLTLSYAHLLGLPYSIQKALGLPVPKINPLMTASSSQYNLGDFVGVEQLLKAKREFPAEGETAGFLGMFDNLVKDSIDKYYGEGAFSDVVENVKQGMEQNTPYDTSSALMTPIPKAFYEEEKDVPQQEENSTQQRYRLNRDVEEYLMASPMKMVFVSILDKTNQKERFMSVGDIALLAVWCKRNVLKKDWNEYAIAKGNYEWLGAKMCNHLLLADLVNFGILGDLKITNKLDTNTDTFHRDSDRLPSVADQKKFIKNTSLSDRKQLALVHSCVNVSTRTHVGRVTATSWAVDALRTYTRGDKDMFAALSSSLDMYHLGHTNSANFVPYFSRNYLCNEQENGLWGYTRRTSEKLAKEELGRGRLGGLNKVGVAKTELAAAAIAISSALDMGEVEAVMDDSSKVRKIASTCLNVNAAKVSAAREKAREASIKRLLLATNAPAAGSSRNSNRFLLKDLWGFFSDPDKRQKLIKGEAVSVLCPNTGFLHAAVPDFVIEYSFESETSIVRLRLRLIKPEKQDEMVCPSTAPEANKKRKLVRNNQDAVLTLDDEDNIVKYNKYDMVEDEEARERLRHQDKQSVIAARISKVCERKNPKKKRRLEDPELQSVDEQLIRELAAIAY
nr:MAG: hypothetical protein [White spot syndrome virus]